MPKVWNFVCSLKSQNFSQEMNLTSVCSEKLISTNYTDFSVACKVFIDAKEPSGRHVSHVSIAKQN